MTAAPMSAAGTAQDDGRVRLLKFLTVFACGGTERQVVSLGFGLDASRFAMRFGCMRRHGQLLQQVVDRGVPVEEYPTSSFYSLRGVRQQLRLAGDLRRGGVQIVHAYNFHGNVFAIPPAFLAGTPVILASIRDEGTHLTPRQRRVHRHVCRLADRVLVNAEAVRQSLCADGFDPAKIVVIRNGLDLSRFRAAPDPRVRASLGIPPGAPVAVLVSRLDPIKGIEHLIDAAARLRAAHPDAHVLIVGDGPTGRDPGAGYAGRLMARARERGVDDRVIFAGYRDDIPAVLAQASVAVLPSLSEGLSNFVLEAMAAGLPVVATRAGGTPELVRDSVNGLLVPPADPAALAAALERLLDRPAEARAMGLAGLAFVTERFSLDAMIRATEALYLELLARRRVRRGWRSPRLRGPLGVRAGVE